MRATTLARASLDDLIQKSTAIVRGKIAGSSTVTRGSMIYTNVKIRVVERYKGPNDPLVEVSLPGGLAGGLRQTIAGVPDLVEGVEYVFFLWTGRNKITHLLGLSQGVLELTRNAQGEWMVGRGAIDAVMLDPASGRVVRDEPFSMRLSEFTSRVNQASGGGASR
ncbi:MAG: hypothetical protein HYR60_28340 [Acidobacteria bacterium]|nr:hypothetical protein [Acidobacteriota bacterium]